MTLIFPVKIFKTYCQKGFTLFELLAVIVLIGLVTSIGFGLKSSSDKDNLDDFEETLTKTINFASSESVIRNKITRLILHLDKVPQTYSMQMASTSQLLLPEKTSESYLDKEKSEEQLKSEHKALEQNFLPLPDTKEEEFSIDVKIIGAGLLEGKEISFTGDFSSFFYPSSEKDPLIVVVQAENELLAISYDLFRDRVKKKYYPLENSDIKKQVEEIFKSWAP